MKSIQNIYYFSIGKRKFKIQYILDNQQHAIVFYSRFFFIYYPIKKFIFNNHIEAVKKLNDVINIFFRLESILVNV